VEYKYENEGLVAAALADIPHNPFDVDVEAGDTDDGAGTNPGQDPGEGGQPAPDEPPGNTEDGTGHAEDGTGHAEDGTGHAEDGTGHAEDGTGHAEDGTGHADAGDESEPDTEDDYYASDSSYSSHTPFGVFDKSLSHLGNLGVLRARHLFGRTGEGTNPSTGRPLPAARSPLHCFIHRLLEHVVDYHHEVQSWKFVGLAQMERYLLGVDPKLDNDEVKTALRTALRIMAIGRDANGEGVIEDIDIEELLTRVRFLSAEEYGAEVGPVEWKLEQEWDTGPADCPAYWR
jgi:hypothetical protein